MVDKDKIMHLLEVYFRCTKSVSIDSNGLVSCTGTVHLARPVRAFPVKFSHVNESVYCSYNQLTTLEGAPTSVGGDFVCNYHQLTSLEGAPKSVGKIFYCSDNQLTTLEGAPKSVGYDFYCINNPLTTLEGMPAIPGTLKLSYSPTLPLLRCLLAKEVQFFPTLKDKTIETILNKHTGKGKRAMFDCQKELEDAGFAENARW